LSYSRSFKTPVGKLVEGSFARSPGHRSESPKSKRPRTAHKRSVSPERRSSPYVATVDPSPTTFQYKQSKHSQPQQVQIQPHVQYMVQQGGALHAFVPGPGPMQYPYSAVQGMEYMKYNMVPPSTVQLQGPSPSSCSKNSRAESVSKSGLSSHDAQGVRKSNRSMAEKRASLLTMTVEEKRLMTCKDWNSGLCPRLDSGKLCVYGGSKKKHICSKIVKASKLLGSKVCWGQHREGEHKDFKDRVEFRQRERRREDSRERQKRREDPRETERRMEDYRGMERRREDFRETERRRKDSRGM